MSKNERLSEGISDNLVLEMRLEKIEKNIEQLMEAYRNHQYWIETLLTVELNDEKREGFKELFMWFHRITNK